MKAILLALASFSTTLLVAQDNRIEEIGKSPVVAKVSPGGKVRMDLCSSAIELVGRDENALRVSYEPDRGNVNVRIQTAGDHTDLRVKDCPRNNFTVRMTCPGLLPSTFECLPATWT